MRVKLARLFRGSYTPWTDKEKRNEGTGSQEFIR